MSKASVQRENVEYARRYGEIPDDPLARIKYILGKKATNEKYNKEIEAIAKKIKRIKTHKCSFVLYKVLKPSARPRANSTMGYIKMYVPHAAENAEWFENFFAGSNLPKISTPCTLNIRIYEQTPSSFPMKGKILAELGLIRPWKRTGDFDNYAKSVADMMQHGMLEDDCLVVDSRQQLFYSAKPRVEVEVIYLDKFPTF